MTGIGYLSINSAGGMPPDQLATELESRGFDSIWLPEHSHIPASRQSPYPGGGDLPNGYWNMMDPFVSLMAAAGASTNLRLCTGICLVLERHVLELAKTVATLDVLSGGRVTLGIGVGWNAEELANHRPDVPFKKRYSAIRDRVGALRALWSDDDAAFESTYDSFETVWSYPKPIQRTVPIALGNAGPVGLRHAAAYADEWCPIDAELRNADGKLDPSARIADFRNQVADAGRDPDSVKISLFSWGRPPMKRLHEYAELGVERIVLGPSTFEAHPAEDPVLALLDEYADLAKELT